MSAARRNLLRLLVPPLLAVGLVGSMTRPMDASPIPPGAGRSLEAPSIVRMPATDTSAGIALRVEAVVLPTDVHVVGGMIHIPILLADPSVVGRAALLPEGTCAIALVQGVVGWLTCHSVRGAVVRVELSDGRAFQTTVR